MSTSCSEYIKQIISDFPHSAAISIPCKQGPVCGTLTCHELWHLEAELCTKCTSSLTARGCQPRGEQRKPSRFIALPQESQMLEIQCSMQLIFLEGNSLHTFQEMDCGSQVNCFPLEGRTWSLSHLRRCDNCSFLLSDKSHSTKLCLLHLFDF